MHISTQADEIASLETLAIELHHHGLHATVREPGGRLPFLDVRNPAVTVLTENIYAQAGSFWWSWGERIAGCDQVSTAADALARVLRTADRV